MITKEILNKIATFFGIKNYDYQKAKKYAIWKRSKEGDLQKYLNAVDDYYVNRDMKCAGVKIKRMEGIEELEKIIKHKTIDEDYNH